MVTALPTLPNNIRTDPIDDNFLDLMKLIAESVGSEDSPYDIGVARLVDEVRRLRKIVEESNVFLNQLADTLDEWAKQSRTGGWSTHQVDANTEQASNCRRQASQQKMVGCVWVLLSEIFEGGFVT